MSTRAVLSIVIAFVAMVVVTLIVAVCVLASTFGRARVAAHELRVSIPDDAEIVVASPNWFEWQGFCSTLAFLVPDGEVDGYLGARDLSDASPHEGRRIETCAASADPCTEFDAAGDLEPVGITVTDTYDNGTHAETDRDLTVIRGCRPGQTLIAWSAGYI
ncbi:hypothetical protein ABLE94_13795 [Gordonia sp. VNK1]|uniref:hypothetical protein n=1 Tax=Gordonia oleivorans TaxID=3156618 RepID=UPI0032B54059